MEVKRFFARSIAPVLMLVAGAAFAQPTAPSAPGMGPGMMGGGGGPGMMGGYGPGPRGGYGPGYGMGGGMMGGCGYGTGGAMSGPGMMGGGMGAGMMGRALWALDLDEAQRKEVLKIGDELRKQRWSAMGAMHDEMAKLRDAAWSGGKRDRAAILAAHKRMSEFRQQQLENSLDAAEKIEKVLKPEQRERLGRFGPWWMMGDGE
jgi:Spy/CpxP family protein refolding chaperone